MSNVDETDMVGTPERGMDPRYGSVELIDHMGDDLAIVNNARQSFNKRSDEMTERDAGLINFLMRERHGTPLEAVVFTFQLKMPIFVARQLMRHRMASYNEVSLRYTDAEEAMYTPDPSDVRRRVGKPGSYTYERVSNPLVAEGLADTIAASNERAWMDYQHLLRRGVASELARTVLPLGTFTTMTMTLNLRSALNLLSLRSDSHAQLEIRELADEMERQIARIVPVAHKAFVANGRTAP